MTSQPEELINDLSKDRCRKPTKPEIIEKVLTNVDMIKEIPYPIKKNNYKWKKNISKLEQLLINLPVIEITEKTECEDGVFYDMERIKKENLKLIDKSCVVIYKGIIQVVYITEEFDKGITKATEKLKKLGENMDKYHRVKEHSFYSGFKLGAKTEEEKTEAHLYKKDQHKHDKYMGRNWLDGMISFYLSPTKFYPDRKYGTITAYQPRKWEANDDDDFMYNFIYTFCALQELEKRYAPAITDYRITKAKNAEFVGAIPNIPIERLAATGLGGSVNFASAIHSDSGIEGLTETIIWCKCDEGKQQYFVSPTIKMYFDLSKHNAIILQPPKIPHGTANTGNHGGYGFVNISKQRCLEKGTNMKSQLAWKKYFENYNEEDIKRRDINDLLEKMNVKNKSGKATYIINGRTKVLEKDDIGIFYKENKQKIYFHYFKEEEVSSSLTSVMLNEGQPVNTALTAVSVKKENQLNQDVNELQDIKDRLSKAEEFINQLKNILNN
tara:strand:+ start:7966 stop:9456 length:1491 start_codon:yes stop_codon:yes gene_type:complete